MAMNSTSSLSEEVGSAEDAVQAFLECLVDPLLPVQTSTKEVPSLSQQQSVAKQIHAVVLLYIYYQKKQHPGLESLGFESFCKLAVILRPTLMAYMKLMHRTEYTEVVELENQLSPTEKAIMNAFDIATTLDATKDVPEIEGWTISKVAVLLVDSSKENCLLLLDSITKGIWSVIEKDLDNSDIVLGSTVNQKPASKRKRISRKFSREDIHVDEAALLELAFSAVKEAAGIDNSDLIVLESHVVYSLSKEKTTARFYIVQCKQSISDTFQSPVKDTIESLQGPLVEKYSGGWRVTHLVEYFQVLPYAGILSDWLSRELSPRLKVEIGNVDVESSNRMESQLDKEVADEKNRSIENFGVTDDFNNEATSGVIEFPYHKDESGCQMTYLSNSDNRSHRMDLDDSWIVCAQNEEKIENTCNAVKVYHRQEKAATSMVSDLYPSTSGFKVKDEVVDPRMKSCITESRAEEVDTKTNSYNIGLCNEDQKPLGVHAVDPYKSNFKYNEKLMVTLSSTENTMSQTALKVLLRKKEHLSIQQLNLEDEIALCNKQIRTILDGGEDDLALKLEAIIDVCNDLCSASKSEAQERTCQRFEVQMQGKRLSETILSVQNPCQELDDICYRNNWTLPTYRISPSHGGFLAKITMKGMDFYFSDESDLKSRPREARESVAAKMITKLKGIEGQK